MSKPKLYGNPYRQLKAANLRRYGQRKVMQEQGWDVARFIREFWRNYL